VRLRLIRESDLEAVRELRNRSREWFFDDREVSAAEQRAWFASLQSKPVSFYVIEEDDAVVGTISVAEREDGFELGNLVLDERFRGRGLMTGAVEQLSRSGGTFYARVKPGNDASAAVFERAGFAVRHLHFERASSP